MPGPVTREVKKYLIQLIVGVVVLDAIMVGAYYRLSVPLRPERTQQSFRCGLGRTDAPRRGDEDEKNQAGEDSAVRCRPLWM